MTGPHEAIGPAMNGWRTFSASDDAEKVIIGDRQV